MFQYTKTPAGYKIGSTFISNKKMKRFEDISIVGHGRGNEVLIAFEPRESECIVSSGDLQNEVKRIRFIGDPRDREKMAREFLDCFVEAYGDFVENQK